MEIMTMGKAIVSARIENLQDTYEAEKGGSSGRRCWLRGGRPTPWSILALRCFPSRGV